MPERMSLKRAVAEGGVIVVSILLAFAIDASWDDRQEHVAATRQAMAVAEELESNARHFANLRARTEQMSSAGLELMAATGPGSEAEPEWVMERITEIWGSPDVDPSTAALTAALQSGAIEDVIGPDLRERLQRLPRRYAELDRIASTLEEQLNRYFRDRLWNYVPQMDIEVQAGFSNFPELRTELLTAVPDGSHFDADVSGLLADMVFENAVVNRTTLAMIIRRASEALAGELQELSGELRLVAED